MCACANVYMRASKCVRMCICVDVRVRKQNCAHIYSCAGVRVHVRACAWVSSREGTCVLVNVSLCTHASACITCMRICLHSMRALWNTWNHIPTEKAKKTKFKILQRCKYKGVKFDKTLRIVRQCNNNYSLKFWPKSIAWFSSYKKVQAIAKKSKQKQ